MITNRFIKWHIQFKKMAAVLNKQKMVLFTVLNELVLFTVTHKAESKWILKIYPLVLPCSTSWTNKTPLLQIRKIF